MGMPTTLQNVDDRGYVFVTVAAECQIVTDAVSVSNTTATPLPASALAARRRIYIKNNTATAGNLIYIGGADVTSTIGWPLDKGDELILDVTDDITV